MTGSVIDKKEQYLNSTKRLQRALDPQYFCYQFLPNQCLTIILRNDMFIFLIVMLFVFDTREHKFATHRFFSVT